MFLSQHVTRMDSIHIGSHKLMHENLVKVIQCDVAYDGSYLSITGSYSPLTDVRTRGKRTVLQQTRLVHVQSDPVRLKGHNLLVTATDTICIHI